MTDATKNLARWRLRLSEFEFDSVHRAVVKHHVADALSRLPTTGNNDMPLTEDVPVLATSHDSVWDNKSYVLMIVDAKFGWPLSPLVLTKPTYSLRGERILVIPMEMTARIFQLYQRCCGLPTVQISAVQLPMLILLRATRMTLIVIK